MKQAKVLIADDDRSITEGLSAILRDEGYEVSVALDGQKALDQLVAEPYGVVLADLKMPKVDGLALLIPPFRRCAKVPTITWRSPLPPTS